MITPRWVRFLLAILSIQVSVVAFPFMGRYVDINLFVIPVAFVGLQLIAAIIFAFIGAMQMMVGEV